MIICTNDKRRRLTQEVRTGSSPYNFAYEYDKGGNRTKKRERNTAGQEVKRTDYYYDLPSTQHGVTINSADFKSSNNRLEYYKVYNTTDGGNVLESTTWYYYSDDDGLDYGNPTRIVTNVAGTQQYTATRFGYAMNGSTVTYAMGESWNWDGVSSCPTGPTGYAINWAREFRYDGARARYLNRQLSPAGLLMNPPQFNSISDVWTDYDDDEPYGDYEVTSGNPPTVTNKRSYQLGMALVDPWVSTGSSATDYLTTDHLGTTRGLTIPNGAADALSKASYTAFGQRISGENHRFGYIGAHGYQQHDDFPFLHVGHRYYDPASGRFLQRDPSGIDGGINVYEYAWSASTAFVDPDGLTAGQAEKSALNPKAVREVAETVKDVEKAVSGVKNAGTAAKAAKKLADRAGKDAMKRFRTNKAFKKYVDETYKKGTRGTGPAGNRNPNLTPEQMADAWESFKAMTCRP